MISGSNGRPHGSSTLMAPFVLIKTTQINSSQIGSPQVRSAALVAGLLDMTEYLLSYHLASTLPAG